MKLYRLPGDGVIFCESCLPRSMMLIAAELQPRFFPGTYHLLSCAICDTSVQGAAKAAAVAALPGKAVEIDLEIPRSGLATAEEPG
jgi:hypothetical protein